MTVYKREWVNKDGEPQHRWTIRFKAKAPDGRMINVWKAAGVNLAKDAKNEELELRRQILHGTYGKSTTPIPTLAEWVPSVLSACTEDGKESTAELYEVLFRTRLLPALGKLPLDQIRPLHVSNLKKELKAAGLKFKSRNNVLGVLSRALNLAVELEVLEGTIKVKKFKKKKESEATEKAPRFLTYEQDELLREDAAPRWLPLLEFMPATGLRIGELCALKWSDIDPKGGTHGLLTVSRAVYKHREGTPKNQKPRDIPLTERAARALKAQRLLTQHLKSEYVFCTLAASTHRKTKVVTPAGSCRGRHSLQRPCARWAGVLGWKTFGPHIFRHTFASHLVMAGVPLRTVQIYMGHSTIKMTERYASLAPKVAAEAILVLDKREHGNG